MFICALNFVIFYQNVTCSTGETFLRKSLPLKPSDCILVSNVHSLSFSHCISSFTLTHKILHFTIYNFHSCSLTCLFIIFLSRLSQSIFSSFIGSRMVLRSASSTTFLSRSPAWWFNLSISICSWYAPPLNFYTHTSIQRGYIFCKFYIQYKQVLHCLHLHCNAHANIIVSNDCRHIATLHEHPVEWSTLISAGHESTRNNRMFGHHNEDTQMWGTLTYKNQYSQFR